MQNYMVIIVAAVLVNNILLAQFLGNCPFLGCSNKMSTATGMSMAVIFVIVLSAVITWAAQIYVLNPFGLQYLQTIVFILVIATLVQFVEMFLKKSIPPLYTALGIYLPLITTNCAVLGVCVLVIKYDYNLMQTVVYSFASSVGYGLALVLITGLKERIQVAPVPKTFAGTAIGLITAGLISLAFFGFQGMVK